MYEPETYTWETLPEYIAAMQYSRCVGRILRSLPDVRVIHDLDDFALQDMLQDPAEEAVY